MQENLPGINHQSETPTEITVKDLDSLCEKIFAVEKEMDFLDEQKSKLQKNLTALESKAVGYLKALGRTDYPTPHGTITIMHRWYVRVPKTEEDKFALFSYLREQGLFDRYATVNSRSINSFYMAEWEAAKRKDPEAAITFSVPGLGSAQLMETLKPRRKKQESQE